MTMIINGKGQHNAKKKEEAYKNKINTDRRSYYKKKNVILCYIIDYVIDWLID